LLERSSLVIACRASGWYLGLSLSLGLSLTALSTIHWSLTELSVAVWCQLIMTAVLGTMLLRVLLLALPLDPFTPCRLSMADLFTWE